MGLTLNDLWTHVQLAAAASRVKATGLIYGKRTRGKRCEKSDNDKSDFRTQARSETANHCCLAAKGGQGDKSMKTHGVLGAFERATTMRENENNMRFDRGTSIRKNPQIKHLRDKVAYERMRQI